MLIPLETCEASLQRVKGSVPETSEIEDLLLAYQFDTQNLSSPQDA